MKKRRVIHSTRLDNRRGLRDLYTGTHSMKYPQSMVHQVFWFHLLGHSSSKFWNETVFVTIYNCVRPKFLMNSTTILGSKKKNRIWSGIRSLDRYNFLLLKYKILISQGTNYMFVCTYQYDLKLQLSHCFPQRGTSLEEFLYPDLVLSSIKMEVEEEIFKRRGKVNLDRLIAIIDTACILVFYLVATWVGWPASTSLQT